jgi:hypothetical protein
MQKRGIYKVPMDEVHKSKPEQAITQKKRSLVGSALHGASVTDSVTRTLAVYNFV